MDNDAATLISTIQELQLTNYFNAVIFTIYVADYLHTLPTEINSLWPAPWTLVKIIFLISRYSPFFNGPAALIVNSLSSPSLDVCVRLLKGGIWIGGIGEACSLILLVYRAYALVGRTCISKIVFPLLALTMIIINISLNPLLERTIELAGADIPSIFPRCFLGQANITTNRLLMVAPIVTIVYETILFGAVYWAKTKKYKEDENWLIRKIYRDALVYYLFLLLISAAYLIMWFSTSGPIRAMPPALLRYFSSIISSRIILNIRQYASAERTSFETGLTGVGGSTTQPVSGIRFASGKQTISAVDIELRLY